MATGRMPGTTPVGTTPVAAKFAKYINSAGAVVSDSALPTVTQELVKIRASPRIADAAGGVTDEAWANAAKHYDDKKLTRWCR
jgi:hypothetical protein